MKHSMKNTLKPAFMALGLALMVSALCHGQAQWSGEQGMKGYGVNNPAMAQVPGTNILQLFYQGQDGGLWTQWRNTNGTWSSELGLGGQLNSSASPTAVQLPGTNILQVFYRGQDNHLRTRWRNANGTWSSEQDMGGLLNSDPAAAQLPGTNILQVFYQGQDQALFTRWWNNGTWSGEQRLGGQLFASTCADVTDGSCYGNNATPVPIQIPGTNALEVFFRGSDNQLRGFQWQNGTWTQEQDFGGTLTSDPSAAPVPGANQIQVFYRGAGISASVFPQNTSEGGSLMTQWGNLSFWQGETQMGSSLLLGYWCDDQPGDLQDCEGGYSASYSVPKAWANPGTGDLWVFYRGQDGGILYAAPQVWAKVKRNGSWSADQLLGGDPHLSDIMPTEVPGTNTMQIFYEGETCPIIGGCNIGFLATQWY
jgi:hypothetical protein